MSFRLSDLDPLNGYGLTELPEEIGNLKNLKMLNLSRNQISKIPDVITELKNLTVLNLSRNQISEISDAITKLTNLEVLNLKNNQISEFLGTIADLKSLTQLDISGNKISEIPGKFDKLTNLEVLDLNDNQMRKIPDVIAELQNLTRLNMYNNKISEIPDKFDKLTNLEDLDLSHNQISKISNKITKLTNLEYLDLSNNQISVISHAISELKRLKIIKLSNNQISEIPEAIIQLENLETDQDGIIEGIDIKGNPIINPPYEIADKGIYAIRAYFLGQQLSRYKDNKSVMKTISNRDKIFVSYSHQDKKYLEQFKKHIKPYVRIDGFEIWDDARVKDGSEWREEIEKALASAKVAVLLVSPNCIASDFIYHKELPPLLNAAEKEGLTIFWIPISASAYKTTEIEKYQSAHPPNQTLDSLTPSKRNQAWVKICEKLAEGMKQSD